MTDLEKQAQQAKEALKLAVADVLDKKRRLGHYAVTFQNGRTIRVEPEQLPTS